MNKKLSISVGALKAASILALVKLAISILHFIFVLFSFYSFHSLISANSQLFQKLANIMPGLSQAIINTAVSGAKLLPGILTHDVIMIVILGLIYALFSIAAKRMKKGVSIKKWAIIVLIASALVISRDFVLLAIGILGIIGGTNVLMLIEEKK